MRILRSPDGAEKVLVDSLDGYDGWTVLAEGVSMPPHHCYWCEDAQNWKPIEGAAERAELLARVRDPEQLADLITDILSRLPEAP